MQHDGAVFGTVRANVICIEPFRQDEINLMGAALPVTPDRVGENEFQFRAIESAFTGG